MHRINLRNNYKKNHPYEDIKGKQAHHIIPVEILMDFFSTTEEDLPELFNEEWNCLMLPARGDMTSLRHSGKHPRYSRLVCDLIFKDMEDTIGTIDVIQSMKSVALCIKVWYEENNRDLVKDNIRDSVNNIIRLLRKQVIRFKKSNYWIEL